LRKRDCAGGRAVHPYRQHNSGFIEKFIEQIHGF
jgi:hypothetical protein